MVDIMTDWDITYLNKGMPKPTNTDTLYPDCFGSIERLEDEKWTKAVTWIVRVITTLIAIGMAVSAWTFYQQFS